MNYIKKAYHYVFILTSIILTISTILLMYAPPELYISGWIVVTALGGELSFIAITLLLYYIWSPHKGYIVLIILLISIFLNITLKNVFALPRPPDPLIEVGGYGFPSGHSQNTASMWISIYILFKTISVLFLSASIIYAVSISRVMLKVHYPHDVIGGLIFGFLIGALTNPLYKLYNMRKSYLTAVNILIAIFSLIVFMFYPDDTLIKISGISFGISIHPIITMDEVGESHIVRRLIRLTIMFIIAAIFMKFIDRYIVKLISYILMGMLIPLINRIEIK